MLTRLPGSKWWIEVNDAGDIIGTYNKTDIIADIVSITYTLERYPDATQDATDVAAILNLIDKTTWTVVRKQRNVDLTNKMYQAYQGSPEAMEAANLIAKRDALIALRDRLV